METIRSSSSRNVFGEIGLIYATLAMISMSLNSSIDR
jgi:hypothetical protein